MTLEDFILKYKLSGRAAGRVLMVGEATIRHWRDGSREMPPHIGLLIRLVDEYRERTGNWPVRTTDGGVVAPGSAVAGE